MISNIIHYCWFGENPKSEFAKKCISSWKRYCPDYEIVEWNEENYDISSTPLYVQQAYEAKKWAFVTDYVRLDVIYKMGGVYFDTDVELVKSIDELRQYVAFFGFDDQINTGLGFGAERNNELIKELRDLYCSIPFKKADESYDYATCSDISEPVFIKYGFLINGKTQCINNVIVFSSEYFAPYTNPFYRGKLKLTKNTYSIHWCSRSWLTEEEKKENAYLCKKARKNSLIHSIKKLPNRIVHKVLGKKQYDKLKTKLLRNR